MLELSKNAENAASIYFSPEVLRGKPFSVVSDVWSAGCVIYEMDFLVLPKENTTDEIRNKLLSSSRFGNIWKRYLRY